MCTINMYRYIDALKLNELYAVQVVLSKIETWTKSCDPFHHSEHNHFADAVLRCFMCFTSTYYVSSQVYKADFICLNLTRYISLQYIIASHHWMALVWFLTSPSPQPWASPLLKALLRNQATLPENTRVYSHRSTENGPEIFGIPNTLWKDRSDFSFRRTLSIKADMKIQNAWDWRGQCEKKCQILRQVYHRAYFTHSPTVRILIAS